MPIDPIMSAPERIVVIQRDLKVLIADFQGRFSVDLGADVSLSGVWYQDVPKLALVCADVQQVLKDVFQKADFTPDDLRFLHEAVRQMDEFIAFIDGALATMRKIHAAMRKQLCDRSQAIVDQLDALRRMPFLEAERRAEVEQYSAPIDRILEERQAGRAATRLGNERIRALAAEDAAATQMRLAAVEQENAVLRGATLSAPAPARAARKSRRARPRKK